jgi:CheY-like chemotaxis protein
LHVVRDGAEALAYLSGGDARQPKLILLDWESSQLDSREFVQRIRSNPDTRWIPVIALAASRGDVTLTSEIGVGGCIVRPFDFEQFMEAVREIGRLWFEVDQTEAA